MNNKSTTIGSIVLDSDLALSLSLSHSHAHITVGERALK